jgi:hypothetical protein
MLYKENNILVFSDLEITWLFGINLFNSLQFHDLHYLYDVPYTFGVNVKVI